MVMEKLGEVIEVVSDVIDAFDGFFGETTEMANPLEMQLDILITIIKGIGEVLQIAVKVASKVFQEIKDACFNAANWIGERWNELKKTLGDVAFAQFVIDVFNKIMEKVGKVIEKIKEWWNNLKKSLGLEVTATEKVNTKTGKDAPIKSYQGDDGGGSSPAPSLGGGGSGSGRGRGKGRTTTPKTPKVEKVKVEPEEGSIKALKDKLGELNAELSETVVSDERLKEINAEKAALEEQIKALQLRNGLIKETPKPEKVVNPLDEKRDKYKKANESIGQVKADFRVGLISKEEAERAIADANAVIEGLGLKPLELHINDDGTIQTSLEELEAYQEKMKKTADSLGGIGNAFGTLGDAIGGTGGAVMEFAGQTLNAAAQIIPQVLSIIGAKQAEAMASGTASAAALPFPANIAAMASIIATVVSLFASIPKAFADGGIVQGNSFHGDSMLARVNSGEMILNKQQQAALYHSLKSGGVGGSGMAGNVTFTIEGSKLKGCLNNYESKQKRIR